MLRSIKRYSAHLTVLFDILLIPACLFCRWLSEQMLFSGKPCSWERFGAKCATCGGTHCVNSFLDGRFADAFFYNPAVFVCILYAIITVILLNLFFVFKISAVKQVLMKMYSLTAFFTVMGMLFIFTLLRNIPWIVDLMF